jgi:hypothetical protein
MQSLHLSSSSVPRRDAAASYPARGERASPSPGSLTSHTSHSLRKPVMAPVFRHLFHYFRTRLGHLGFSHHHAWPLDFNDCIYGRPTISLLFLVFPNPEGASAGWHACYVRSNFLHRRRDEPGAEKNRRGPFFFSSSPPGKTIWAAALLFYQGETWITLLSGLPTCYGGT